MPSSSDFQILNPPKAPYWRDHKRLAKLPREFYLPRGMVVAPISACCAVACLWPTAKGYGEAISMQIAKGEPLAWLIMACVGSAALSAVPPMLKAGRYVSAFFFVMVEFGLWKLVRTNPYSADHLSIFGYIAGGLLLWLWCLWLDLRNPFLLLCCGAATFGAFGCLLCIGVGERIIILSTLAALNTLLMSDLLD